MAGNNYPVAVATGDNYGGLTAGQVNITDDSDLRRRRIISWLCPLEFRQKQENVFSDAHQGTGQWFLESKGFTGWLNGSPKNLWCYGAPGSGKTVLASIAINDLRQRFCGDGEVGIAAVYCEWKRQDILSPINLLASIWSQLVVHKPLAREVEDLYDHHTNLRIRVRYQEILSILKREVEKLSFVYIVLDALDELDGSDDRATVFIDALSGLTPAPSQKVRILATSRSGQSLLPRAGVSQITAMGDDIERFVEYKILQGISISTYLSEQARNDKALKQSLVGAISKQSSGLFLLARLFVQNLKYKTNLRGLRNAIRNLPPTINEQYKETWRRIEEQNPDHRSLARRILSWLSHAIGPLKAQELRHALAIKQGDNVMDTESLEAEDLFLLCCHGLISIERETQIVRLVHYTAQQYLDENRLSLFPDAQAEILRTCLTYLSFNEFKRGRCTFESFDSYGVNEVAKDKRIAKRRFLSNRLLKFPFLQYAASNWGRHAIGEVGLSHRHEILAFLQNPMLLESAAQAQDSDLLYSWPRSEAHVSNIRKNLPLFVAGSFGLDHITAALLTKLGDFDVNAKYGSQKTMVLHQAVETGNTGLTRVLLDAGADPQLREARSVTGVDHSVLYKAIAHGHNTIVDMLLSYRHHEVVEPSAIYCATFCENDAAIRIMIARLGDESNDSRRDQLHQTLFHAACLGRTSVIELTMRLGADLEAKDRNGQTALFLAVRHGRLAAVEMLLKAKASVTARDAFGASLLQIAVSSHEVIAERLCFIRNYGLNYANIPQTSRDPCTMEEPMVSDDWFMQELDVWLKDCRAEELLKSLEFKKIIHQDDDHTEILKKVLAHGADVNEQDSEGQSILHRVACSTPQRARALLEVSRGRLNIDPLDNDGRTPLHYAAAMDKAETMELLLDYGANILVKDKYQATTLHFSVTSAACAKLTIECGGLIHAQDSFCRTALHYAAMVEEPNEKIRDVLIRAGVRPGTVDLQRKTAQDYFNAYYDRGFDRLEVMEWICDMFYNGCYLLSHGALYAALDNSHYYQGQYTATFSKNVDETLRASAEKNKTWSIVSDSEEEDFEPSDN
ncbi:MAG: hypothetical protein Q9166_005896 [cf. Caloplaca sp. 2 TL-2023]